MANDEQRRPHLFLSGTSTTEPFTVPTAGGGGSRETPPQDRKTHSQALLSQLAEVRARADQSALERSALNLRTSLGLQVTFDSMDGVALAAESLARDAQGIELMNVQTRDGQTHASVFIPDGKLVHFERLIADYVSEKRDARGRPRDNQRLIDAVQAIRAAAFDSIWTDSPDALPPDESTAIWWEAWLPAGEHRGLAIEDFERIASAAGMKTAEGALHFPERSVKLLHGTRVQITSSGLLLNSIAELRRATDTAEFFDQLPLSEQTQWAEELSARTTVELSANQPGSYITLLDTGVNNGHQLLAPLVDAADLHTVQPYWLVDDANGHGTQLAGLALYGDLRAALASTSQLIVGHRLESVKILEQPGGNKGESYGDYTIEAVARVEVVANDRRRVFSMAVASADGRGRGRPSSWSSTIDRLASDYDDSGASPRLFVLAAGNTQDPKAWTHYPASLATSAVHDPGQAWNALTVGAYTQFTEITEPYGRQYSTIAPSDALSPFTTTSATWQQNWPIKPDIVLEGGNAGVDAGGFPSTFSSLSLLTTHHQPTVKLFDTSNATSAASALASKMSAELWARYPEFWPETVRGVLVHSARWTQQMLSQFNATRASKKNIAYMLRHCGFGAPSIERALWSASNSLTMIVQDTLTPYEKTPKRVTTRDMHMHALPWPIEELESLGAIEVTLRVTLSYFIEPNPGERGNADKYAYQSHALRFAVRRPLETEKMFRQRINARARLEDEGQEPATSADGGWFLGEQLRRRGSISSDTWTGTAQELANRGQIAVYPAMGWWRNRPTLERYERTARYALVISIEAPEVDQDLYAAVQQQVELQQSVAIE